MMKPLICIAGKNKIAVVGLKISSRIVGRENVVALPNPDDDGVSRWQPWLVKHARELNIKTEVASISDLLFISLKYDRIIKPSNFSSKNNLHFFYLPVYKGCYTSAWPILNGESVSSVTLHVIDYGIDTGDIICQKSFPIEKDETARSLYKKYIEHGSELINCFIENIVFGQYTFKPQSSEKSTYFSRKSLDSSSISIDVNTTANMFYRQIRAFIFPEYQSPVYPSTQIKSC